jgi:hypothetical protein
MLSLTREWSVVSGSLCYLYLALTHNAIGHNIEPTHSRSITQPQTIAVLGMELALASEGFASLAQRHCDDNPIHPACFDAKIAAIFKEVRAPHRVMHDDMTALGQASTSDRMAW